MPDRQISERQSLGWKGVDYRTASAVVLEYLLDVCFSDL
jgi:hypothetical protein